VLHVVQDRQRQKEWLGANGFPIGPYALIQSEGDLAHAQATLGAALFVKACEGGYDGRSQLRLAAGDDARIAFEMLGGRRSVAEQGLDLELELSVLVARRPSGETVVYPPAQNHHEQQILAWSVLPAELPERVVDEARGIAQRIAVTFPLEGILAIELFLLRDGRLLVNELAPRPHNSYHASELACPTSQFEQLVRCACDLPLGAVTPTRPSAIVNLFGDHWLDGRTPAFDRALEVEGTRLFLYGKSGPRAGRKMGHLGATGGTVTEALERAQRAFSLL
jgi:5-(carboxyamino)imidazole ribonucleotide synthase